MPLSTLVVNAQPVEPSTFGDIFSSPSLVQKLLPVYDYRERFAVDVCAPGHRVHRIAREFDLASVPSARAALRLRGVRSHVITFDDLDAIGIRLLTEQAEGEFVLGSAGTLWWPSSFKPLATATAFTDHAEAGTVKAAFSVRVVGGNRFLSRLSTEVRIQCLGSGARRRFGAVWLLGKPMLSVVLRDILWAMKRRTEIE